MVKRNSCSFRRLRFSSQDKYVSLKEAIIPILGDLILCLASVITRHTYGGTYTCIKAKHAYINKIKQITLNRKLGWDSMLLNIFSAT